MTGLNWFQAEAFARRKFAIRRAPWDFWVIYRAHFWIIIEIDEHGVETRRPVTTDDWRDTEFLAKDFTLLPAEGMTLPACCNTDIPKELLPATTSQSWTLTDFCGGDGDGGNVIPITGPGITLPPLPALEFTVVATTYGGAGVDVLVPDGDGCWTAPPEECMIWTMVRFGPGMPSGEEGGAYFLQFSASGADLSGDASTLGELRPGVTRAQYATQGAGPGDLAAYFPGWDGAGWPSVNPPGAANNDAIPFVPGAVVTARVDYLAPGSGKIYTLLASLTNAAECPP